MNRAGWKFLPEGLRRWLLGLCLGGLPLVGTPPSRSLWTSHPSPPVFEHLSVGQGLSQSTVHWIVQDHLGFLWMGTDAGLNRYDGYQFQVFHPDKARPEASLGGDRVNCLLQDRRGFLWVATNGGLCRLDPETLAFQTFRADGQPGSLPSSSVMLLAEDSSGVLWIGTESGGVCRLDPNAYQRGEIRFENLASLARGTGAAPTDRITALYADSQGRIWWGSVEQGLGCAHFREGKATVEVFGAGPVNAVQEDASGCVWVGGDAGLFRIDPGGNLERPTIQGPEGQLLGRNPIRSLNRDRSGQLWVCSDGSGLFKLLPGPGIRFQGFRHDSQDPGSLSSDAVQFVYEDASSVLWVSSYQAGLNKLALNPRLDAALARENPAQFTYRHGPADGSTLSGDLVASLGADRFGNLWVGTDGSGLNRVRASQRKGEPLRFERFRARPGVPGALQEDVVLVIHRDQRQRLWLGTYRSGIVRVDQEGPDSTPRFTHFRYDPKRPQGLASNFIRGILDDGAGKLWIATETQGLNHFDPDTGLARRIALGPDGRPWMRASPGIHGLAMDAFGTLWMATPDGLNRYDPVSGVCREYLVKDGLSDINLTCVLADRAGRLWVGSGGGGLTMAPIPPWDGPSPRFTSYGPAQGLPSLHIKGILEDEAGQLWLSLDRSLCRFDPEQGRAAPLPWKKSFQDSEFTRNAAFKAPGGELFFGSNQGFVLFHPSDLVYNETRPRLAFTQFQVLNRALPLADRLKKDAAGRFSIQLQPGENTFAFSFAALHFVAPEQNRYAYRMEGLDSAWNATGPQRSVSYARVPPGRYVLRVRGSNCDGFWNEGQLTLGIEVLPAWYQTWWFRTLIAGLALGAIVLGIRWRLAAITRRNRFLEATMAEQARLLREAETLKAMEHMTETADSASEDLMVWVGEMAREVSRAVDAVRIDVWEVSGEGYRSLTDTQELPTLPCEVLKQDPEKPLALGLDLYPVLGPSGEVHAALQVQDKRGTWTTLERQLLTSFLHHLGSAYHLRWLRETLLENRRQRTLDRQILLEQGSGVLQLCPACKRCFDEGVELCPDDGTPLDAPRLLPFRFLGRYRLERLLGEGATSHVFEAWDEKLGRAVALKAFRAGNFEREQSRERFAREARVLARLEHPHIVAIHDTGELEDGTVFLVMERLRGCTVGALIRRCGPARPEQAARLLHQVCSALASTHAKGLVHRDLKPENLFAASEGDQRLFKVLDFGLAKAQVIDGDLTHTGALMGTPHYMSPEQVRGRAVDWRSDLYSLAAIVYECLSGQCAVPSKALAEIFVDVIHHEPAPLSSAIPDCPAEVENMIRQALSKDPEERPQDLLAWASRLESALQAWERGIPGWPEVCQPEQGGKDTGIYTDASDEPTIMPG